MRQGVHKAVYIRERLEFPAAHFFHASFGVFKNLSASLFDEGLLYELDHDETCQRRCTWYGQMKRNLSIRVRDRAGDRQSRSLIEKMIADD